LIKFIKLTDVVEIISGVRHFPDTPSGIPTKFLRILDLNNNLINTTKIKSIKVAIKSHQNLDKQKKIKKNDIIFSIQGTIGVKAIANKNLDCYVSSSMLILRPKNIVPEFLLCALNSRSVIENIRKLPTGDTIKRITLSQIREHVKIPYPSKSEQVKTSLKYHKQLEKTIDLEFKAVKAKINLENFSI
jgi:type I restriction enzyme, S subunit